MDELEEIKKKKLESLQRQQQEQVNEEAQLQQQIQQLDSVVKQFLTKEALIRYGNIKTAHPQKFMQLLTVLGQLVQSGKINNQINDEQLKELLVHIEPQKKEFTIKRK